MHTDSLEERAGAPEELGRKGRDRAIASVVIPAHNEASVIGKLLGGLSREMASGEIDVVVACNACTDDTAAIARGHGATAIEIDIPSKIAALNAGDRRATAFPRIYVDADVAVDGQSIVALAREMARSGVLCASLPLAVSAEGRPWLVRAFFSVWQELPYVKDAYVGSGIYGLSEQGRARFGEFPDVIADDLFIRNLFARSERCVVDAKGFVIEAPWTLGALLRRRARIIAGNLDLLAHPEYAALPGSSEAAEPWWKVAVKRPRLLAGTLVYAGVNLVAHYLARRNLARSGRIEWGRDETTRRSQSEMPR